MKQKEFLHNFAILVRVLNGWGLTGNDFMVTDKFIGKFFLQEFSYSKEIHTIIPYDKIPWKPNEKKNKAQLIPPEGTKYFNDYMELITHDIFWEIEGAEKQEFLELLKYAEKIKLYNFEFWQLAPLFHAKQLKDALESNMISRKYNRYEHNLDLQKKLLFYAKKYKDKNIFTELKKIENWRNENFRKIIGGTIVNNMSAEGRVKLVFGLKDRLNIKSDEIVVCDYTNVGWLPYIYRARGVISQKGGITSHTAIVCRELNKPCIVGVEDALFELRDGDIIKIDANNSCIKMISPVKMSYL
jgi:phosphohistidine swiveling domain-containing protein